MNFEQIIHNLNPDICFIWKLEKYKEKLNREFLLVEFNKTCLDNRLIQINYLSSLNLLKKKKFYYDFFLKLLKKWK